MVSIPSATTPSCGKNVDSAHMIQPVIAFSRSVSAAAAATTPDAGRALHPEPDRPADDATIRSPFSVTSRHP
jgi:hypothetical protein